MDNNMFGTCSSLGTQPLVEDPIRIFPNPAAESLFIDGLNQKTNIIVRDCQGKIVIETSADVYSYLLNTSHLASGIYFISIPQINQKNYKILVQK
jgi:hypothetical protein